MSQRQRTVEIRQYIIDQLPDHPSDISKMAQEQFGITRQAVSKHLREMEESGAVQSKGQTSRKKWELVPRAVIHFSIPINKNTQEDRPWREIIKPALIDAPQNVVMICAHGFTEMLNNVIDHSDSETVDIRCVYTAECIDMTIIDNGVGIFRKIKKGLNLADERESILELAKGKVTTDPTRHTGEGVFFTSRMCDIFRMWSGNLYFTHVRPDDDWLIETDQEVLPQGTYVRMTVSLRSNLTIKEVFDKYTSSDDDSSFSKTHVPIRLAQYDADSLISRSQARRVLARFDRFNEVLLDFSGVDFIGQAFSDEIFRVYRQEHPELKIVAANANPTVTRMIRRARAARHERQLSLFERNPDDDE